MSLATSCNITHRTNRIDLVRALLDRLPGELPVGHLQKSLPLGGNRVILAAVRQQTESSI